MIKLVVSDLDGTLIDSSLQLPNELGAILETTRERGVLFSVATGRSEGFIQDMIDQMGLRCPYVVSNGATLLLGDQTIMRKQFPLLLLKPMLEQAIQRKLSIYYTHNGYDRVEALTPWIEQEMASRGITYEVAPMTEEEWPDYQVEKLQVFDADETGVIGQFEAWCKAHPGGYTYVRYGDRSLEFMEQSVSKASGVKALAEYLGLTPEEIMAVGDDGNDLELFRYVGRPVAVHNAIQIAKETASYVCENPRARGVLEAVQKFC